jgi:glycosyltransferase involved in cell wall biosynthesis
MPLKILLAHNYYQQSGGEDTAFESEVNLLRERGGQVVEYIDHNDRIKEMSKISTGTQLLWSRDSYQKFLALIEKEKPDVAHFHNIFPLISPSAYYACEKAGIPVLQALDNPRLLCPSANFYRNGHLCQECLRKTPPWPSIKYGCYRNSRLETIGVASMLTLHRWMHTWQNKVTAFLVATDFYRRKFIEGGLPAQKFFYKPYFISPDPGIHSSFEPGNYALYIGRLDPEKGIKTMLTAWENLTIPLKIRGSGQLESYVKFWQSEHPQSPVEVIQRLSREDLSDLIQNARFLVWPSLGFYETFGFVTVESFANGVPVIASDEGVTAEVVANRRTGLHFHSGDASDLASKVGWMWNHPQESKRMGREARLEYENKFTAEKNYEMLMAIYRQAIESHKAKK